MGQTADILLWLQQSQSMITLTIILVILSYAGLKYLLTKNLRPLEILLLAAAVVFILLVYIVPWFRQYWITIIIAIIVAAVIAITVFLWKKDWIGPRLKPPKREELLRMDPYDFENYIGELLKKDGWTIIQPHGRPGDKGKDLVVTKIDSGFGAQEMYIQCKRYQGKVTPDVIRELNGVLPPNRAGKKGIVVCVNGGTQPAQDEAKEMEITIWDYNDILNLWKRTIGQTTLTVPPISTPPLPSGTTENSSTVIKDNSWHEVSWKDLSSWAMDQFSHIIVNGKIFAYRINRSTGKFERKHRRRKDAPWHKVKYEDLSSWAMDQFAKVRIRGKIFVYRLNRDVGKFERKLK